MSFGRVVAESALSAGPVATRGRDTGTVVVEFIDQHFAEATGVGSVPSSESSPVLVVRRLRTSKLAFANTLELFSSTLEIDGGDSDAAKPVEEGSSKFSERLKSEIASLARLDRSAIDFVTKESTKSPEALASLFSAGLPDAVLSAIDVAERQMNSLEPREDIIEKISQVGKLCTTIADQLFTEAKKPSEARGSEDELGTSCRLGEGDPLRCSVPRRLYSGQRRLRLRDASSRREVLGGEEASTRDVTSQHLQAYQQRRSMLLSLMSRARRGTNSGYLSELIEREQDVFGGDLSAIQGMAPTFSFGSPNALMQEGQWNLAGFGEEEGNGQNRRYCASMSREAASPASNDEPSKSFLYSVLRCGEASDESQSLTRGTAASQASFARHLVASGILMDNVSWVKACVEAQAKKIQLSSIQKSASMMRDVVDEEGTPILQLAIAFGCCPDVLTYLISRGACVGPLEVKEAATTDQPTALSVLLQHTSYQEYFSESEYSPGVNRAFAEAKRHQEELDTKMREAAGAFMIQLLRRLLVLGLAARRHHSPRVKLCSKAIAEIFVGNVLLRNLQQAQLKADGSELNATARTEDDEADLMTDFDAGDFGLHQGSAPMGLLAALPLDIITDMVVSTTEHTTRFLSLVEDYLCSKDMSDIASGLSILHTLLTKIPSLSASKEMERFGLIGLLSFHDALATSCMNEILTKQSMSQDSSSSAGGRKSMNACSTVVCPKKHTAVIHITRHSSFRCDICGRGVERGRPMHGCRECDWDACEHCTDKSESGLVKSSAIKDIAGKCLGLLSQVPHHHQEEVTAEKSCASQLQLVAGRLMQRDVLAFNDLCSMLKSPGSITLHEFLHIVLPTLHDCFVGRSTNDGFTSGHRSKKARVGADPEDCGVDTPEERLLFCKEAVGLLVRENVCTSGATSASGVALPQLQELRSPVDVGDNDDKPSSQDEADDCSADIKCSEAAQELLRRLHQILSLRENVQLIFLLTEDSGRVNEVKGSDLQSLTRPVEIKLCPSSLTMNDGMEKSLLLHAEPLVPMLELKRHILRSFQLSDPSYVDFCIG